MLGLDLQPLATAAFARTARAVLEALTPLARAQCASLPPLYRSGVRWRLERAWTFTDPWTVYRRQWGTCAHLCLWRVAELRNKGIDARYRITLQRDDGRSRLLHVTVRVGSRVEDPSRRLGMP